MGQTGSTGSRERKSTKIKSLAVGRTPGRSGDKHQGAKWLDVLRGAVTVLQHLSPGKEAQEETPKPEGRGE